jgi:RNA polymerase sigma-70 factor (ECF subfamily)
MLPDDQQELLERLQAPATREAAFTELIRTYQEQLYTSIFRLVTDGEATKDILQNTFIKVWKHLAQFRGESRLSTWIYRIGINEALNWLEQEKKKGLYSLPEHLESAQQVTQSSLSTEQIERKLEQAIRLLPDKQRTVFLLRYYEEMPYEEMSKVLQTSEGALKASYHHAVKKIQHILLGD